MELELLRFLELFESFVLRAAGGAGAAGAVRRAPFRDQEKRAIVPSKR